MKFEGVLEDVENVEHVFNIINGMYRLSDPFEINIPTQFIYLRTLESLKGYGNDLTMYSKIESDLFIHRSVERNMLMIQSEQGILKIMYVGTQTWFIHFLRMVKLFDIFDSVTIKTFEASIDPGFVTEPHRVAVESFAKLPLDEQRTIIQKLVSKAAYNGEDGNFIHYGSFKTTEDEQGVGWFVIDSKYLKEDENSIIKHYFNSKENNIRVNTLKEFMALSKSIDRVRRHI